MTISGCVGAGTKKLSSPAGWPPQSPLPAPRRTPFDAGQAGVIVTQSGSREKTTKAKLRGIVHGKTIELPHETGLPEGSGGYGHCARAPTPNPLPQGEGAR